LSNPTTNSHQTQAKFITRQDKDAKRTLYLSFEMTIDWCQTQIRPISSSWSRILGTRLQKIILLEHG